MQLDLVWYDVISAPDGVASPTLTSPESTSIRARWEAVGRWNADQAPAFQLQFRETREGAMLEKYDAGYTLNLVLK